MHTGKMIFHSTQFDTRRDGLSLRGKKQPSNDDQKVGLTVKTEYHKKLLYQVDKMNQEVVMSSYKLLPPLFWIELIAVFSSK